MFKQTCNGPLFKISKEIDVEISNHYTKKLFFFANQPGFHQNAINFLDLEFEKFFKHSLLECFISENNKKSN